MKTQGRRREGDGVKCDERGDEKEHKGRNIQSESVNGLG